VGPPKAAGKYMPVDIYFGFEPQFVLVVSRVPALGRRGSWWLLTNLNVQTVEEAWEVVEAYRKRWQVEEFFRLIKAGLGIEKFQVSKL
jgi:IS4 transposase